MPIVATHLHLKKVIFRYLLDHLKLVLFKENCYNTINIIHSLTSFMSIHNLPFGEPEAFNAVIEIPKGSQDKYEYDEKLDVIKLDRVLFSSQIYPANYGFIPETRAADGDHSDVLLLSTNPLAPGTVAVCRPIGIMDMVDAGEVDNKIIAVPVVDPRFADVMSLEDLPVHALKEIQNFFETYKILQNKKVEVKGFRDKTAALEELKNTRDAFTRE
jgi:inorganic pyrophosphatase